MDPRSYRSLIACAVALSVFLALAVPLCTALVTASGNSRDDAPANTWGGAHVRMEVTNDGATLEFDCATGSITEPLPSEGKFSVKGTFTPEHGGPIRQNEASRTTPATYSGTIEGDTMDLRIEISGKETRVESYKLVRGQAGRIVKCR
jgi:hypothetical protein